MNRSLTIAIALVGLVLPGSVFGADLAAGKATFDANCSACHGLTGKGDGPVGAALPVSPRDFSVGEFKLDTNKDGKLGTDADLKNVIQQGAAAFGGTPLMAPWPTLTESDINNIIAYIRTFKK